jgi:RIO-like serine/threonine protein kinase
MSVQLFTKVLPKGYRGELEIELQTIAARHGLAPRIISVFEERTQTIVQMEDIGAPCLAEIYGENPQNIPQIIWQRIHTILELLFEHEGIEYVDITPYNFLQRNNGGIVCIDYGDAYYTTSGKDDPPTNWFLAEFLDGNFTWNPDFK